MQVEVKPQLLTWAIERSMKDIEDLMVKIPHLSSWQNQTKQPTLKQLENFAKATFTPIGMLFLPKPPKEKLPISDFRTFVDGKKTRLSANLLDTIYSAQQSQEWYKTYAQQQDFDKLSIIGKYNINDNPKIVAQELSQLFSFHYNYNNWQQALSERIELIEKQGILVMSSGIALGNTHRALDLNEFRGFALSDEYAPVIFINSKDSVAARSFTLMHELAHIAIAEDGVSNTNSYDKNSNAVEKWCDKVAAEILVPEDKFKQKYQHNLDNLDENLQVFAKHFKVSTLVILGRIYDLNYIYTDTFWQLFQAEKQRIIAIIKTQKPKKSGGDYYNSKPVSVSKLFIKTIISSTLEGKTLYRDAMRLLNIKSIKTFNKLAEKTHPWI